MRSCPSASGPRRRSRGASPTQTMRSAKARAPPRLDRAPGGDGAGGPAIHDPSPEVRAERCSHRPPRERGCRHAALRAPGRRERDDPGERHGRAGAAPARARGAAAAAGAGTEDAAVRIRAAETLACLRTPTTAPALISALPRSRARRAARGAQRPGRDRGRPASRPAARRAARREQPGAPAGGALPRQAAGPRTAAGPPAAARGPRPQDALRHAAGARPDPQPRRWCRGCCPSWATRGRSCASPRSKRWARIRAPAAVRPLLAVLVDPDRNLRRAAAESLGTSPIRRPCPRCSWPSRTSTGACAAPPPPRSAASAAARPPRAALPGWPTRTRRCDAPRWRRWARSATPAPRGRLMQVPRTTPACSPRRSRRCAAIGAGRAAGDRARLRRRDPRGAPAAGRPRGPARGPAGRRLLLAALADDSAAVRAEAALALGDGGVPGGRSAPLMDLKASDPSPQVRQAAAAALKKLAPR